MNQNTDFIMCSFQFFEVKKSENCENYKENWILLFYSINRTNLSSLSCIHIIIVIIILHRHQNS